VFVIPMVLSCGLPGSIGAQPADGATNPRLKTLGINVAIGGLTGGVVQLARGHSFFKGMLRGSAGGATVFLGKCIVARHSHIGDWVGVRTAAIGGSMIANASAGRGMFERIGVPFGPIRVTRDASTGRVGVKLDLAESGSIIYMRRRASFSWDQSLKHGLPVFEGAPDSDREIVRVLSMGTGASRKAYTHELVHAAQGEFLVAAWQEPLEEAVLRKIPGGKTIARYFDLGILYPVWNSLNHSFDHEDRPWEQEARFFESGC
jgi:hypothetical protein